MRRHDRRRAGCWTGGACSERVTHRGADSVADQLGGDGRALVREDQNEPAAVDRREAVVDRGKVRGGLTGSRAVTVDLRDHYRVGLLEVGAEQLCPITKVVGVQFYTGQK